MGKKYTICLCIEPYSARVSGSLSNMIWQTAFVSLLGHPWFILSRLPSMLLPLFQVLPAGGTTEAREHPEVFQNELDLWEFLKKKNCFPPHISAKELSLSWKVKFVTRKENFTIPCLNKLGSRIFSSMLFPQQANVSIILFSEITIYYPCRRP